MAPILPTGADIRCPARLIRPPTHPRHPSYRIGGAETNQQERVLSGPNLTRYDASGRAEGLLLVLHGGKDHSPAPVTGRSPSWRRAQVMARALSAPLHDQGLGVWVLRYRTVGWNGD